MSETVIVDFTDTDKLFVRVMICAENGAVVFADYENCWAAYVSSDTDSRLFVYSYSDPPSSPPRAVFCKTGGYELFGDHPAALAARNQKVRELQEWRKKNSPEVTYDLSQLEREVPIQERELPLPVRKAIQEFEKDKGRAEDEPAERKYLESDAAQADPKEQGNPPEEVEKRRIQFLRDVAQTPVTPTVDADFNAPLSPTGNREQRRLAQGGSHKKAKTPKATAFAAMAVGLLSQAFRFRHGV